MTAPIDIMLVEDDPGDVWLTREAFAEYKLRNRLLVYGNGRHARDYLRGEATRAGGSLPDLILLDLNLPGLDGRDLLTELAGDPALSAIPVVVLTNSLAERDILRARRLQVVDYVVKPVDFHRLVEVVRHVEGLAFTVVHVPARA